MNIMADTNSMEYPYEKGSNKIMSIAQYSESQMRCMHLINMPLSYDEVKSREEEVLYMVAQLYFGFPYEQHKRIEV